MPKDLDQFTQAYAEAAFWSSSDENDTPMDQIENDPAPELWERFERDCADFQAKYGHLWADEGASDSQVGHDFWLTRNHHGAGFWDRGDDTYSKAARDKLTEAAHAYGSCDLYIGDDGLIHAA